MGTTAADDTDDPGVTVRPYHSYSLTLARLAARAEQQIEAALADDGLRLEDWRVLDHLAGAGRSSMAGLSAAALLTGPTLSRTVDRLASRGLAYRSPGVQDRRQVLVALSRRGRTTHARLLGRVRGAELSALHDDSADADIRRLASMLLAPGP